MLRSFLYDVCSLYLDLHLRQSMLPDDHIWCDTVLTVVKKDDPDR